MSLYQALLVAELSLTNSTFCSFCDFCPFHILSPHLYMPCYFVLDKFSATDSKEQEGYSIL